MLGDLFNTHWELKKQRSTQMSNGFMDECYEEALKHGARGGKLMGAGGGGFFVFYCLNGDKPKLSQAMKKMGLKPVRFHFDMEGAKILVNT
jgi:D-glycero-alpha-D-manno-heptose-7-phosphate kinase